MKRLAVLVVEALSLIACASTLNAPPPTLVGTWDDSRWGPLAVVDVPNRPAALAEGTLEVTDRCVFLIKQGERVLLVWPADETEWDA
ncbi:MAG TPA: hypothetical protein VK992_05870, partial [Candidatus Caenarcaniphilales bacterium]|nr:hypothetical protein [Candidatus Caenarcaniphilales bacterium]